MVFDNSNIEKILKDNYNINNINFILEINMGFVNSNYEVSCGNKNYILKFEKNNSFSTFNEEIFLMNFLNKNEFDYNMPLPLLNNKSNLLSSFNSKNFYIYEKIEGAVNNNSNFLKYKNVSQMMAKFHSLTNSLDEKLSIKSEIDLFNLNWLNRSFKNDFNSLPNSFKSNGDIIDKYNSIKSLTRDLAKIEYFSDFQLIHGDYKLDNVIFSKNVPVGLIDFNNICYAPKIKDIAELISRNIEKRHNLKNIIPHFLENYSKQNNISDGEISILPLVMLRNLAINFWWFNQTDINQNSKLEQMLNLGNKFKKIRDELL